MAPLLLNLASGVGAKTQSILIVDDEPDIREAVRALLARAITTADVHAAGSGAEGLAYLRTHHVDLIVTDFKMPGMDGLEFLSEAKKIQPGTPRILITAFERELADQLGPRAGVECVLTKPLEPRPLVAQCQRILDKAA